MSSTSQSLDRGVRARIEPTDLMRPDLGRGEGNLRDRGLVSLDRGFLCPLLLHLLLLPQLRVSPSESLPSSHRHVESVGEPIGDSVAGIWELASDVDRRDI